MNKNIFKKYFKSVYAIVLFLAIILFLLAVIWKVDDIWQSTLLNLSTELLGVVLVFFLVQYLFKLDEFDTNTRIDKLLSILENKDKVRAENLFHSQPDMNDIIEKSREIKIVGVTLTVCIDKGMGSFRKSLKNGAIIKLILIDGSDESFKACAARSETNSVTYFKTKHAATMDNIDYLLKYSKQPDVLGEVHIKRISYPPTIGVEVYKNNDKKSVKVEIYPQHTGWDKPPIFTLDSNTDTVWYEYFEDQFDAIWSRGKEYILNAQNNA